MDKGNSGRKVLSTSLKIAATVVICGYIVRRLGWGTIVDALSHAKTMWIWVSLGIFLMSGLLSVAQWQILLKAKGIQLPFARAFVLYFVGLFFNNFMLGIGGDAFKVAVMATREREGMAALGATFLDRFAGLMVMAVFALVGSGVLVHHGLAASGHIETALFSMVAAFLLFLGVLLFLISSRIQRIIFIVLEMLPIPGKAMVTGAVKAMVIESHNRKLIVPVALLSFAIQAFRLSVHLTCAAAFGLLTIHNFQYFLVFVPILAMMMIVPMPFGVKESVGTSLFLLAGFSPEAPQQTAVMVFLASLVSIVASLPGGILFITGRFGHVRQGEKT